jgi:hypothetical protein
MHKLVKNVFSLQQMPEDFSELASHCRNDEERAMLLRLQNVVEAIPDTLDAAEVRAQLPGIVALIKGLRPLIQVWRVEGVADYKENVRKEKAGAGIDAVELNKAIAASETSGASDTGATKKEDALPFSKGKPPLKREAPFTTLPFSMIEELRAFVAEGAASAGGAGSVKFNSLTKD